MSNRETVERLRKQYPAGTKVELVEMNDPYRHMPPGLKGIVKSVDDACSVHINWENGSTLAAIHGVDVIKNCD